MSSPPSTRVTTPAIQLETAAPTLPPPRLGLVVGAAAAALALMLGVAVVLFAPILAGGIGLFGAEPAG